MVDREIRIVPGQPLELREGADGRTMLVGYTAVFNSWSVDLGGFRERIDPGAFTRTLRDSKDIQAVFAHDDRYPLGRTSSGTLKLAEDSIGLRMEVDLPDTTAGRDVAALVKRGDIRGNSFAFVTRRDEWDYEPAIAERVLRDVDLFHVGPVLNPAYQDTTLAVRSLEAARGNADRAIAEAASRARVLTLLVAGA